jgi:hypothetical protein
MRTYLFYLMMILSSIYIVITPTISNAGAKPLSSILTNSKKNLPQQSVERFFNVKQLPQDLFTMSFLAKQSLVEAQSGRDRAVAMLTQKYGAFKRVELIEGDKYRVIFGNAPKDTVIGQFRFDRSGRIDDMEMSVNAR